MRFQKFITVNILAVFLGSTLIVPTTATAQSNTGTTNIVETSNTLTAEEQAQADKLARDIATIQAITAVMGGNTRNQLMSALENGTDLSIDINPQQLRRINAILKREQVELLPSSTRNFQIIDGGYAVGVENSDGSVQIMTRSVGSTAWQISKCAAAIGLAIVPASKAYKAMKLAGGAKKFAEKLVKAKNKSELAKQIGVEAATEILGIQAIVDNCKF